MKTYIECCEEIVQWLYKDTNGKINLTAEDMFNLHPALPALCISTFYNHMKNGQNAIDVLVGDEYCAKLIYTFLNRK